MLHLLLPDQIHRALHDLEKLERRIRGMDETFRQDVVKVRQSSNGPESDLENAIQMLKTLLEDVDDRVHNPTGHIERDHHYQAWLGDASLALAYRTVIEDLETYRGSDPK